MATLAIMNRPAKAFFVVARCEDVSTSSELGKGKPLHPRRRKWRRKQTARLNMRQPIEEQRQWKAEAAKLGITLTDLVRAKMNETEVKVARVTDPALFREVRRIGLNMNQITHGKNAGLTIGNRRLDDALALFTAIFSRMLKEFD
ncbi:MAG: hypothetical protein ABL996_22325 [Micropepsaceae bacterium]